MTKAFWKATFVRALRTFAQAAMGYIGTGVLLSDVKWWAVLSAGAMGAILSVLMSIATGLPEVEQQIERGDPYDER